MAPKKGKDSLQSVFKLELKSRQDALRNAPKVFVPRKAHKKSRGGCQPCKQKRVKCDGKRFKACAKPRQGSHACTEVKPTCTRCTKLETECHYASSPVPADFLIDSSLLTPCSDMYSMSIDLVETDLSALLSIEAACLGRADAEMGNVRILQHFQSVVSWTLGCSRVQNVMHWFVAKTAWSHPYLMHMILALSCAHRKRVVRVERSRKQLALAEATHWESGLQLYRRHLGELERGSGGGDWDAEVATTFLQIMFTFALEDSIPLDSVNSTEDAFIHAIEPFNAIGSFRALFHVHNAFKHNSEWSWILLSTDDAECTFTSQRPGIEGLPRALVDLCDLDETSSPNSNPYHRIVRALSPLLHLERSHDNFSTLFAFMGRTWPDFKPLVLSKDPRGLLLISYWLALLRQVDQWWLTTRAKTECMAITAYLSSLRDPKINALLPFPAAFGVSDATFMWRLLEHTVQDIA